MGWRKARLIRSFRGGSLARFDRRFGVVEVMAIQEPESEGPERKTGVLVLGSEHVDAPT